MPNEYPGAKRGPMKSLASRVGHDAVWVAIAGLFCIVEGAVKVTEYSPAKALRAYRARRAVDISVRGSELALR